MKNHSKRPDWRSGFSLVELAVVATIVATIITLSTTLTVKTAHVWKDIAQCRVAVAELNNHLDRLTRMEPDEARQAIAMMQPSSYCRPTLANPQIAAEISPCDLGWHITLQLTWNRRHIDRPVRMTGWIVRQPEPTED